MIRYLLLTVCFITFVGAKAHAEPLPVMPWPQSLAQQAGQLQLGNKWLIAIEPKQNKELKAALKRVIQRVEAQTGQRIKWKLVDADDADILITAKQVGPISNVIGDWDESYQLNVSPERAQLSANHSLGILRGLETLLQLIGNTPNIQLPLVTIEDFPRFKWRGLLLDTSRHFFPVDTVKRQLDAMAAAKYNIFHWHLTDDQGWRFESRKYPKLHKLASDGQFYSHRQIREVVNYARARGIQVLPEIDMPGHASAIAVAYPELMSAPGPYAMEYRWGVHKPLLNPANDAVYKFVDEIIGEVAALFPFEYLHIGGDEVDPEHWNTNEDIQAFMKTNGLKDFRALQAYFNQRVQKILRTHQRKMIGWDEIQHRDLPKDIVIHSWRGPDGISDAVSHGFQAILSTGYYLDQPQYAAYHYRNDPFPPAPVNIGDVSVEHLQAWYFEMPRKRGKPVTGIFTLVNKGGEKRVFVDFTGKSRREANLLGYSSQSAKFSLDTWMGPVQFTVKFDQENLSGHAIVGNAPYILAGEKIPHELLTSAFTTSSKAHTQGTAKSLAHKRWQKVFPAVHLSAAQQTLILGGEAALWAEIVDEHSLDLRLWPRAFVVAEGLWSAQSLQDEIAMYERLHRVARWAEKSVGLQHTYQQRKAIQRLLGATSNPAEFEVMEIFMQLLEPAHYYHRQHEKSAHETYSKADPLNRLVDALPAENEVIFQFNQGLTRWLADPQDNDLYGQLQLQLQRWSDNRNGLRPILARHPQWLSLADNSQLLATTIAQLLEKRVKGKSLLPHERESIEKMIFQHRQIDQEIIIALVPSLEKILYSFN